MTTRKVRKPRKLHDPKLETPTARLLLTVRRKPYNGPKLARGVTLQYRRNNGNGAWVLKVANGHGNYWTKAIAEADDFDPSNGKTILDFFEVQEVAKKLVGRGDVADDAAAPVTVDGALKAYKADLIARSANPYNADWPRIHLTSALLSKPVALLDARELKTWRDSLLGTMAPSTINRLGRCLCAALEQAAQHDKRIQSRSWEIGLALLPNAFVARNIVLPDDRVRAFVSNAYGLDHQFGLLTDTLATTGARPSQAVRLRIEDLHDHPVRPKLMMPKSGKGGDRNRNQKKHEHYSVPITVQLAARLKQAAKGRAADAPLLLQSDGTAWPDNPGSSYHREVDKVVAAIEADPDATMYSLRHSSIVRQLLAHVPIRIVAATHDTSTRMIEKTYSKWITEHERADDISRAALLQPEPPSGQNVVALAR
jgi:integrase